MSTKPSIPFMCLAALAMLSGGCGPAPKSDPGAVSPARPVRLAYGRKIHYAPQIVALREGYFGDAGLEVTGKVLMAGIQCAEALSTGAADAAVMGDAPAVIALASSPGLRLVASYGGGERMHRIVAGPGVTEDGPSALAGRRLAVQKGSSTHGALLLWLRTQGLGAEDVEVVDLSPRDMPEAMAAGQIDAAAGSEPWPTNILERVPGSREVAVLSGLGNEFPLVMLVTSELIEARPEAVRALLRATVGAVALINADPERAAALVSAATGVSAERELRVLRTLEWSVRLDQSVVDSLAQTAAFLVDHHRIPTGPDLAALADRRFCAELEGTGVVP